MTATNLVTFTAEPQARGIKEALQWMLDRAERDELSSVAIAYVGRGGEVGSQYSLLPSVPLMLGSIRTMEHRIIKNWDERDPL